MSADSPNATEDPGPPIDATRRTWLAAERTWLAWWRTALGGTAVSVAVGRFLPGITHSARWPFAALGLGYGVLAILVLVIGLVRQQRTAGALRRGSYAELSSAVVILLTVCALLLALATLVIVAVKL